MANSAVIGKQNQQRKPGAVMVSAPVRRNFVMLGLVRRVLMHRFD